MSNSKWLRTKLFFITLVVLVMCIFKPKDVEDMYRLAEKGKEEEDIDRKIAALQSLQKKRNTFGDGQYNVNPLGGGSVRPDIPPKAPPPRNVHGGGF